MKKVVVLASLILCSLCLAQCSTTAAPDAPAAPAARHAPMVVLDIGHRFGSEGASAPRAVNGKRLSETSYWYEYSYYIKQVVEKAGYRCIVCNRGDAPSDARMQAFAQRAGVVQLNQKQKEGRYASVVHPDRYAAGQISADYAIQQGAACVVFLHHNSLSGWSTGGENAMVLYNRYNGKPLADSLCQAVNDGILNHGLDNKGKICTPSVRYKASAPSAGWMNACDDSGIPAAVTEITYLSNANHVAFLTDDENSRRYAECIGQGIVNFLKGYNPAVRHVRADDSVPDEGSNGKTIKY